jgi:serine/threonine-protein kinase RsbW
MKTSDTVSVLIPIKPEYVSIARLTVSGIASRAGFDIDTIEDIKVAISEVIGKIIEKCPSDDRLTVDFTQLKDGLSISFSLKEQNISELFNSESDRFALAIISSLMDEIDTTQKDSAFITLIKKLGKAV